MAHDDGERPGPTGSGAPSCPVGGAGDPVHAGDPVAAPDAAAPDAAAPDAAAPDAAATDAAAPDTAAPDTAAPDTAAPDTAAPDTAAPDTAAPDTAAPDTGPWPELPAPLRARLAEIAGLALGGLPGGDVPTPLRRFAKFTPAKRARLGGQVLVARLQQDPAFRAAVVAWWAEHRPGELELPDRAAGRVTDPSVPADGQDTGTAGHPATAARPGTHARPGTGAHPGTGEHPGTAQPTGSASPTGTAPEDPLPAPVDKLDAAAVALLTCDPLAYRRVAEVGQTADLANLRAERDEALAKVDKLTAELERARVELVEERDRARALVGERETEYQQMRRRVSEQGARLRAAVDARAELEEEVRRLRGGLDEELARSRAETAAERERADRERHRAEAAAGQVAAARQAAREARRGDEVRLELLLDTVSGAISGLRRELDVGAGGPRPADLVAGVGADRGAGARVAAPVDGLAALDALLTVPSVHLIVDGYNVSKTGYPELPLADQRSRLVAQLGALGARTGAEITVVFDGAAVIAVPVRGSRGVRVLFSDAGVIADDVVRDLVAAEPAGRPLLVATSDQEIVRSVRRRGAHTVASAVLLRRLGG